MVTTQPWARRMGVGPEPKKVRYATGKKAEKIIAQALATEKESKKLKRAKRIKKFKKGVKKTRAGFKKLTATPGSRRTQRRGIKRREKGTSGILSALGVTRGKQTYKGAGRPRGTYKHGVPIHVWKAQQREQRQRYARFQAEQYARLKPRGFSPEQVQQLQQQQTIEEFSQPQQPQTRVERIQQRVQQRVQRQPIQIIKAGYQKMKVPTNMHNKLAQPGPSVADEELEFRKWSAESSISPSTQRILDQVRRIQNKGKRDNIEQQRRLRERNMVGRSMNLMKAHENMIDVDMDMTGVDSQQNILMAPNVFREVEGNQIMQNNRGAHNLLNTKEAGNDLRF